MGSILLRLNDNLRAIVVGIPVGLIQKCALLGSEGAADVERRQKQTRGVFWFP